MERECVSHELGVPHELGVGMANGRQGLTVSLKHLERHKADDMSALSLLPSGFEAKTPGGVGGYRELLRDDVVKDYDDCVAPNKPKKRDKVDLLALWGR